MIKFENIRILRFFTIMAFNVACFSVRATEKEAPVVSSTSAATKKWVATDVGTGISIWQEILRAKDSTGSYDMNAIFYLVQLSLRETWVRGTTAWTLEGLVLNGQTNIQVGDYFNRGNATTGIGAALGMLYMSEDHSHSIGLNLPVIYRVASVKTALSDLSFENKTRVLAIPSIELGWELGSNWWFNQRLGTTNDLRDALWMIQLFYRL